MASITAASAVKIQTLLKAARQSALSIQKLGQGKYQGSDINAQLATQIDAELAALQAALVAITA